MSGVSSSDRCWELVTVRINPVGLATEDPFVKQSKSFVLPFSESRDSEHAFWSHRNNPTLKIFSMSYLMTKSTLITLIQLISSKDIKLPVKEN